MTTQTAPSPPQHRTRLILSALILIVLAVLFWTGSRYPALDEKAMMSGAIQLEDSLSFEALVPLTPDMSLPERMFWSTINWVDTNKKGMTFGVLFAAAFLTLTPYLRRRSFVGAVPNAARGVVIGTPLGVCVNCAAPIARGMYSAGLRAETTLAAMIASPTLNVVVLTMAFSILPFYMAVAKIALSLLVILVAVPLICRALPVKEIPEADMFCPLPDRPVRPGASEGVTEAVLGVLRSFVANLWYIINYFDLRNLRYISLVRVKCTKTKMYTTRSISQISFFGSHFYSSNKAVRFVISFGHQALFCYF